MKLELKHIAPYLPYGLQYVRITDSAVTLKKEVKIMGELSTKGNIHNIHNNVLGDYTNIQYLPILRPLSDLTKEIEVSGEKFIPAEFLWGWDVKEEREFILDGKIPSFWKMNIDAEIGWWEYKHVVKLFEMHFDIFGLIEQDLAIDINSLKP